MCIGASHTTLKKQMALWEKNMVLHVVHLYLPLSILSHPLLSLKSTENNVKLQYNTLLNLILFICSCLSLCNVCGIRTCSVSLITNATQWSSRFWRQHQMRTREILLPGEHRHYNSPPTSSLNFHILKLVWEPLPVGLQQLLMM